MWHRPTQTGGRHYGLVVLERPRPHLIMLALLPPQRRTLVQTYYCHWPHISFRTGRWIVILNPKKLMKVEATGVSSDLLHKDTHIVWPQSQQICINGQQNDTDRHSGQSTTVLKYHNIIIANNSMKLSQTEVCSQPNTVFVHIFDIH